MMDSRIRMPYRVRKSVENPKRNLKNVNYQRWGTHVLGRV